MKSLKNLYCYGPGPSSSHTIGPMRAAEHFKNAVKNMTFDIIHVTLYGSLALTGKGHHTPDIISKTLKDYFNRVDFNYLADVEHPNKLTFEAILNDETVFKRTYYSIGGGTILCKEDTSLNDNDVYPFKNFEEIKQYLNEKHYASLSEIVLEFEGNDIYDYMSDIFNKMVKSIHDGLKETGKIQAGRDLFIDRNAARILQEAKTCTTNSEKRLTYLTAYAYAVGEENGSGHNVVTAPTCGSSGVVPAVVYYLYHHCHIGKDKLVKALMSAGLIGDLFKQNATISGAVGGCQAEIGVAVCMATAIFCDVYNLSIYQIEYGCELAMEHHLGLTCDPIDGFVVIPCVERNAVGAVRAHEAYLFAKVISKARKNFVSLDEIVATMRITGNAIPREYRETSEGGISKVKKNKK